MLDTDTFSYLVKGSYPVQQAALKIDPDQIKISVVTQAEVWFGMQLHPSGAQKQARIRELFEGIEVLPLDSTVAASYATIRAPITGIVTDQYQYEGEFASAGCKSLKKESFCVAMKSSNVAWKASEFC